MWPNLPSTGLARLFEGHSQTSINFKKIFLLAHGNFEEQNKVLQSSTIITHIALIIVINTYNYYIIFLIKSSLRNAIREKMWA